MPKTKPLVNFHGKKANKITKAQNYSKLKSLNYDKVIRPANMKSQVWNYFGYPGSSNNEVITKETVICSVCLHIFKNNHNTTNLRLHLGRNHADLIMKDTSKFGIKTENSKIKAIDISTPKKRSKPIKLVVRKEEFEEMDASEMIDVNHSRDDSNAYIEELQHTEDPLEEIIEYVEDGRSKLQAKKEQFVISDPIFEDNNRSGLTAEINVSYKDKENELSELKSKRNSKPSTVIDSETKLLLLRDMIIEDLQLTDFIEMNGFQNFANKMDLSIPTKQEIEDSIHNYYLEKFSSATDYLKLHSSTKPYSLSYEKWKNIDNQELITFYFNYISEEYQVSLKRVQLKTIKYFSYSNYDEVFDGFDLKNCTAVIADLKRRDRVQEYFSKTGVPVLQCFGCKLQNTITKIFNIIEIEDILNEIKDNLDTLAVSLNTDISCLYRNNPYSKYNAVRFFCEDIAWTDDPENQLLLKAKSILEQLTPLNITMESLDFSENNMISILKPIIEQLLQKQYCITSLDSPIIKSIKNCVNEEFSNDHMIHNFFEVATFFDPRFQHLLTDTETVHEFLIDKIHEMGLISSIEENPVKASILDPIEGSKKSTLTFLFGNKLKGSPSNKNTNSFETSFQKYKIDGVSELDENPIDFWTKYGFLYGHLKQLSQCFVCIPSCCSPNCLMNTEKQRNYKNKRFNLPLYTINEILFLNFNKN